MEYPEDSFLLLSGIQHFIFCRRQWALIHIEQKWEENLRTVEGNIMHKRAHDDTFTEKRKGVLITRGLPIFSRQLGVTGQCDIVEFIPDGKRGCEIYGYEGKYRIEPVEYKRGKEKAGLEDTLQVVAQAMCLEEMLSCTIDKGYLFYGETRHRVSVEITDDLRKKVRDTCLEMHELFQRGHTPLVKRHAGCKQCSLCNECLLWMKGHLKVDQYLEQRIEEARNA